MRASIARVLGFCLASTWLSACAGSGDPVAPAQPNAGGSGPDLPQEDVASAEAALSAQKAGLARWSSVVGLPIVPVSAANLPDGQVLFWSAEDRFGFGQDLGRTYTARFNPSTLTSTERLVSETAHDMFCPGTANLADGRILVNGGLSSGKTSIFDPVANTWTTAATMNIPRAYQGTVPLADGSVLTLGGSWSGGVGNKHGEVWTSASGWRRLPGVPIDPFLSFDPTRNFGMDSHLWLWPCGNGRVLNAGPGVNLGWIDTNGDGSVLPAGRRADDEFSINGSTVMYEAGKILKTGGGPGYDGVPANANSYVIDASAELKVRKLGAMAYRRAFHNSVVLPNGQVLVIGGMTFVQGFSDSNAVLAPELFDPQTETFVALPPMSVPRNYHSVALLLPDGRVVSAGGGLCGSGCAANHADLQILSPPYLFNDDGSAATRPTIETSATSAPHGTTIQVTGSSAIASFALVRASSTTHAVNNDQRRLALTFRELSPLTYELDIPANPGWAVPGQYMLFGMNAAGTPSVARILRIGSPDAPVIAAVADQTAAVGAAVEVDVPVRNPSGRPLSFDATGLPPGVQIDPALGTLRGAGTLAGSYRPVIRVSDGVQTISTELGFRVVEPGTTRYVRLEALSEVNGNPWTSAAEINLIDDLGNVISQGAFTAAADSAEVGTPAQNAVDGDPATFWHTAWQSSNPPPPHTITIALGGAYRVVGLRYLPRKDASRNGTIAQYRVRLSEDGVSFGAPVAEGSFAALGAATAEQTVYFNNVARGKLASASSVALDPARAIDGDTNGLLAGESVAMTNADDTAFWEVDLGASHQLYAVRLWPRTDASTTPPSHFYVLASDAPMAGRSLDELLADSAVAGVEVPGASALPQQLVALKSRARYVRVQLASATPALALALAELEVYGRLGVNRAPQIGAISDQSSVTGSPTSLAVPGTDPDLDALTFDASGLPRGLAIDPVSGVISGAPLDPGSYTVSVSAADSYGASATASFLWFVGEAPPALGRVAAPLVAPGAAAAYTAEASGQGPFEYSWSFGDGSPATDFSSDFTAVHSFTSPGVYTVTVTARTSSGSATSRTFYQAVGSVASGSGARATSNLAYEVRSGQNARLWVVNPDQASVSVFDAVMLAKITEIPVGSMPRSLSIAPDGRVWVANKGTATLSVISPSTLSVVQTVSLPRASQPYGVLAAADGNVYVTLEATGVLLKLGSTGSQLATLSLGANVRHMALTPSGDRLMVTRFITRFQPGEATSNVATTANGVPSGADVLMVLPSSLTLDRTITLQHSTRPDTTVSGRGVPNYLGAPAIAPSGAAAWVPSKQDNLRRGVLRDLSQLDFQNTVRGVSSRVDLLNQVEQLDARLDHDNAGMASAALYHPNGVYVFTALEPARQVAVVDAQAGRELFRLEVGRAPSGLSLSADGRRLFVHAFMDRQVAVFDLAPLLDYGDLAVPLVAGLATVGSEALSATVLRGKQLFYDARDTRMARDAYISCATCHDDGGHDGRTWDFTGVGEGLRNTISLRGRAGSQGRLHWSGNFDEVHDFEGQLRTLAQGAGLLSDAAFTSGTRSTPLGTPKAGESADLDALAAYVASLTSFAPSPLRTAGGALTSSAAAGRTVFVARCTSCHGGADYTDSASLVLRDVGTLKASSGSRLGGALVGIDPPTLRDAWATAPYLHDGSAPTLSAAVSAHSGLALTATELSNVADFVGQIGSEEAGIDPAAPVGTGLTAQYFANTSLSAPAVVTRVEAVSFSVGSGTPAQGVPTNNFTVRWSGQISVPSTGAYRFRTVSDNGARAWVNGRQVVNNWSPWSTPSTATSGDVTLTAGQRYDVVVEYIERSGNASMQFQWRLPGTSAYVAVPAAQLYASGLGLRAEYFANPNLTGAPALTRTEAPVFSWAAAAPAPGLPADNFSVRWTGRVVAPATGVYRFSTISDDGVRFSLGGTRHVDNWTPHSATTDLGPEVTLWAGQSYDVVLEFNELGGDARLELDWLTPGATAAVPIPAKALFTP